jgi:VIT1/CCC1 family predicted Fe2+/Mn2+ transporter
MQAFFDALAASTTLVVIALAAVVVAIGVLVAGARRTRMDDAALAATLAAAWRSEVDAEPVAPLDVPALIAEARALREADPS